MSGFASFDAYPTTLAGQASVFVAFLYNPETKEKFLLPNVKVEAIQFTEGATPPTAQFSYILDNTRRARTDGWPSTLADVWAMEPVSDYVIRDEEEIVVYEYNDQLGPILVFHGLAQLPAVQYGEGEGAGFTAIGVACRLWDVVIEGAHYRDGDDTDDEEAEPVPTSLDAVFNPRGLPNKTPDGHDYRQGEDDARPLFVDERVKADPDAEEQPQSYWDLGGFVRYLAWTYNAKQTWVKNPVAANDLPLDTFLQAVTPKSGDYFDLKDESTYTRNKIIIRSLNVANKPWIEAVEDQLRYHGFYLFFNTREDEDGGPLTEIIIFRKDGLDGAEPVSIEIPEPGGNLTDKLPDANSLELTRDRHSPVNEWVIQTGQTLHECSFVLCPLFPINASDASDGFIAGLAKSQLATADGTKRKLYRWHGLDECGEGHWPEAGSAKFGTPFDFDDVFGKPENDDDPPLWVKRLRPGVNTLNSRDNAGIPYKAELAISTDYDGDFPAVWERGKGTWRSLANNAWRLLPDRCGVELLCDNPDRWTIPTGTGSGARGDVVRGVKALAAPDAQNPRYFLRLTVVIASDRGLDTAAAKRAASPSGYTVRRSVDGKDHYKKLVVHKSSIHSTSDDDKVIRDDTKLAKAKAEAMRGSHEFPATGGGFGVPWISHAFGVGDLVKEVKGRGLNFATNIGTGSGESPYYPTITAFTYQCQEPQGTYFQLSDRRGPAERA